ncbi:MAG: arginase family protein [Anaerolineales bacterium]
MNLTLIPSPFSLDQHFKGMGRASEALLSAGLVAALESDSHTVAVAYRSIELGEGDRLARIGRNGALLAEAVADAVRAGTMPVILGGDCLVSIGAVAGLRRSLTEDFGIAWFDAHGDFNTPETTISGYLGGMPLACVCGRGLDELRAAANLTQPVNEANVALLGVRDLDPAEKDLLDSTSVRRFDPTRLSHYTSHALPTYLHFDIDVLDPAYAPGVNYPAPNGLTPEAAIESARKVQPHLAALSLTAVDPERDPTGQTVQMSIELLRGILRK